MEKINIYRKKLSRSQDIELRQDLIVQDLKQDIVSILDYNNFCYLSKVEIENGRISVNGNVDSYISYISSGDETSGLNTSIVFQEKLENSIINNKMNVEYEIIIVKQDIKIINERKINISIDLKINYDFLGAESIDIYDKYNEIDDIQLKSSKVKLNSLIGVNSNLANLKEEINVKSGDIISDILKVDTNIFNKEVKISYNKILTKADFYIKIIYLTSDGRIGKAEEKFPIMSFIDLENIKEENICSTNYQIRNIALQINNGNENSISLQMEYSILCKAFEIKEQEIVSDLYSLKYDTEFQSREYEIMNELDQKDNSKIEINENIELENVKEIIDVFGKTKIIKNNIVNNISNIEGELELKIYYETENKIGLNVRIVTIPFIHKIENLNDIKANCENLEFDLTSNKATINVNIVFNTNNIENKKIKVVQDITKKDLIKDDYSMVVYNVKKNDTLWNISKKFRVKQENVINSNGLEEPYNLDYGKKIYIIK